MDPLLSVWSAVNRLTGSGKVLGEDQTVSVLDALKSVTIWGAYQFHEERMKGSLEPGQASPIWSSSARTRLKSRPNASGTSRFWRPWWATGSSTVPCNVPVPNAPGKG